MNHEEFTKAIHKQQMFINKLFIDRHNISKAIEKITKEYYSDIIGKFFYISSDDRGKFRGLGEGYYFIYGVGVTGNYVSDDRVDIYLLVRKYGITTHGMDKVIAIDIIDDRLYHSLEEDMKAKIEKCLVSEEEAVNSLRNYCDILIGNFTKMN